MNIRTLSLFSVAFLLFAADVIVQRNLVSAQNNGEFI